MSAVQQALLMGKAATGGLSLPYQITFTGGTAPLTALGFVFTNGAGAGDATVVQSAYTGITSPDVPNTLEPKVYPASPTPSGGEYIRYSSFIGAYSTFRIDLPAGLNARKVAWWQCLCAGSADSIITLHFSNGATVVINVPVAGGAPYRISELPNPPEPASPPATDPTLSYLTFQVWDGRLIIDDLTFYA